MTFTLDVFYIFKRLGGTGAVCENLVAGLNFIDPDSINFLPAFDKEIKCSQDRQIDSKFKII